MNFPVTFLLLLTFMLCTAASAVLIYPVRRICVKLGIVDRPTTRSLHGEVVARGAGLAMVIVCICSFLLIAGRLNDHAVLMLVPGSVILAALSFFDDMKGISAGLRLVVHLIVAFALWWMLGFPEIQVTFDGAVIGQLGIVLSCTLAVLWLAGYANAFNFMDGINGLAAFQAIFSSLALAVVIGLATGSWNSPVVYAAVSLSGAACGFLPYNFPQARVFMGDVGSITLGFCIAGLTLLAALQHGFWLLPPLLLLQVNFILDTGITHIRRILRGERCLEAHCEHFYQRLVRSGQSHTSVTLAYFGLQCVVVLLALTYISTFPQQRPLVLALGFALWLIFFALCERSFQRAAGA